MLAGLLPNSQISGLDFAKLAIDEAVQRHPQAEFLWTPDGEIPHDFDVIVSSNCLEHFEDPLSIATDHVRHCRSLYVILVPYKEHPLHEQHFAQFRDESFPDSIGGFSRLAIVPFPVENEYWHGWQVLVLYGAQSYLERRTRLEDLPTYLSATVASLSELTTITQDLAGLSIALRAKKQTTTDLKSRLDVTASRLEVTEEQARGERRQTPELTIATLDATKAELSDERREREGLATRFVKAARSASSATSRFSISKESLRLLPTSWGAALSCYFVKRTERYGRWRAGLCARGAPLDAVSRPLGKTPCVLISRL